MTAPVLITGRSGSGKELAARAIHFGSRTRATGPFVPVNCAAIPEALFESTMFGHRRGAFTGAHENQMGFIEQSSGRHPVPRRGRRDPDAGPGQAAARAAGLGADAGGLGRGRCGSTCASSPPPTGTWRPWSARASSARTSSTGSTSCASTCRSSPSVPPTSRRWRSTCSLEIGQEHGTPVLGVTEEALEALRRWRWPGNVRELRNVLERALIAARGRRIDRPDLPLERIRSPRPGPAPAPAEGLPPEGAAGMTLAEVEKAHVEKVLALCDWNRSAAAKVLGIDRRTLFSKIQRYGIIGRLRAGPDAFADRRRVAPSAHAPQGQRTSRSHPPPGRIASPQRSGALRRPSTPRDDSASRRRHVRHRLALGAGHGALRDRDSGRHLLRPAHRLPGGLPGAHRRPRLRPGGRGRATSRAPTASPAAPTRSPPSAAGSAARPARRPAGAAPSTSRSRSGR